jgi:hypothetical protein
MIKWFKGLFGVKPKPSLEDEVLQDAKDLEEQILHDELKHIDQRYRIEAHRAKKHHLIEWLQRQDRPQSRLDPAMLEKFGIVRPRSGD